MARQTEKQTSFFPSLFPLLPFSYKSSRCFFCDNEHSECDRPRRQAGFEWGSRDRISGGRHLPQFVSAELFAVDDTDDDEQFGANE